MISALCSCQNVIVMNQMADTLRTKVIKTNKLALLHYGVFNFSIYDKYEFFVFFYKDVLSQALSEDAA